MDTSQSQAVQSELNEKKPDNEVLERGMTNGSVSSKSDDELMHGLADVRLERIALDLAPRLGEEGVER